MKMRLNFVRSIMHKPNLMFFDEPTSGLDPVNAHVIKEIILEQKRAGKTVFLTTHKDFNEDFNLYLYSIKESLQNEILFII